MTRTRFTGRFVATLVLTTALGSVALAQTPGIQPQPRPIRFDLTFDVDILDCDGSLLVGQEQKVYVQIPPAPNGNNPLLLIFHGQDYDEHWNNGPNPLTAQLHQLMNEAASRGWISASVRAYAHNLTAHSYANPFMDQRVTAVIDRMEAQYGINDNRIYTLGYSMGGADSINYAARHQDPYSWRIAAAFSWSGVLDVYGIGTNNGQGGIDLFCAMDYPDNDPLPYILASSVKVTPQCIQDPPLTCGAIGTGFNENWSQIFNTAEIAVHHTRAKNSDICPAKCAYVTLEHFQTMHQAMGVETLPNLTLDDEFNLTHGGTENFDADVICNFFQGKSLAGQLPTRAYKTVAAANGRYGYFDVTLANTAEPGVFGWEFYTAGAQNYLHFPGMNDPMSQVTGISGMRFRVDDPSPFETDLVGNQYLWLYVKDGTSPITFVIENYPDAPNSVKFNGSTVGNFIVTYNPVTKELTLDPNGVTGQQKWELENT